MAQSSERMVPPLGDAHTLAAGGGPPRIRLADDSLPSTPIDGLPAVTRDAYEVGLEVAQGGIGRVSRARDRRLDRPVAIKELLVWNERQEQRFVREALLTARLQHPAIVPIYEAGRWPGGEPFYAMKLVSGRSLADLIGERPVFTQRLALLTHVLTAAQAVAYAHSQRIIHRDLKPENVLVGEFGETVVIDWGLAKDLAEDEPVSEPVSEPTSDPAPRTGEGLTMQGSVVGTPSYMPPEQAAGAVVDERADVYALGAMLYHVLAAVAPYHGVLWERLLPTIAESPPHPLEQLAAEVSDDLVAIVHKAMARDPAARYPSARELADDLARFQAGQIVAAHTYSAQQLLRRYWRRHRAALSVAAAACGLVAIVVLAAFVDNNRERSFAQLKEREAVEARRVAEEAGTRATARADGMTLLQAQQALGRDPNRALAWLKTLSPEFTDVATARRIAADAQTRGISRAFHGHTEYVNRFDVSPDGARAVTASDDKTARLWDLVAGETHTLVGHTDEVWNAQLMPASAGVATVSKDSTLRLWDARTGAPRASFVVPAPTRQLVVRDDGALLGAITTGAAWILRPGASAIETLSLARPRWVSLSADGRHLLVHPETGAAYVHDLESNERTTLPGTQAAAGRWFLDSHGTVALRLGDKTTELWDLSTGTRRVLAVVSHSRRPAFSSQAPRVAFAVGADIHIYDTRSAALVRTLTGHDGAVQAIELAHDDLHLASGGVDRTVRIWDLNTGDAEVHAGFDGLVTEIEMLADGRSALAVSSAGEVRLFAPRRAGQILSDHDAPASGLALATDGRVASIDDRGHLRIHDLEGRFVAEHRTPPAAAVHLVSAPDGRSFAGLARAWIVAADGRSPNIKAPPATLLLATFDTTPPRRIELPAAALDLAWSADGRHIFVGLVDGTLLQIDRSGTLTELDRSPAPVTSVASSHDGAWVAAGGEDGSLRLHDRTTGRTRLLTPHKERITALAFAADDTWLASGCADHTARLWRVADSTFRSFDEGGHGVEQVVFSGDGHTLLLLSGGETQLRRLDVATGEQRPPIAAQIGKLLGFTLAADGRRLLARDDAGATRLIDLADGGGRTLVGHLGAVTGAGFAADGRLIVTLGHEGTVRAWPDDLPEDMPALRAWIDAATSERVRGP